jgi:hypothetical protein
MDDLTRATYPQRGVISRGVSVLRFGLGRARYRYDFRNDSDYPRMRVNSRNARQGQRDGDIDVRIPVELRAEYNFRVR